MTKNSELPIPHWLLDAAANCNDQLVMIIGAGCSKERPTSLPLASECAEEVYRKLTEDNVLAMDENLDSSDLSLVAQLAHEATGSNEALVKRLRPQKFVNARPNRGHRLAIALMLEGAVRDIVTLNFDLALSSAVSDIAGSTDLVSSILGPEQHDRLATRNIIYLHRSANAPYDDWILTADQLDEWKDSWEEIVVNRVAPTPNVVFVGLGAPANVLTHSIKQIGEVLEGNKNKICYVNPTNLDNSPFATELNVGNENHVKAGWCEFLEHLSDRVKRERLNSLINDVESVLEDFEHPKNAERIATALGEGDLLLLGQLCARALQDSTARYRPVVDTDKGLVATLLAALETVAAEIEAPIMFSSDGVVRIQLEENGANITILLGSGCGRRRFSAVAEEMLNECGSQHTGMTILLIGSCIDGKDPNSKLPGSLVGEDSPESLVGSALQTRLIDCTDLLQNPSLIDEAISA